MAKFKFDFSGETDKYNSLLRQFTLDKLLMRINTESAEIMKCLGNKDEINGAIWRSFNLYQRNSLVPQKQEVIVSVWNLIDLAYHAILATNDFRGDEITRDEELYALVSAETSYYEENESAIIRGFNDDRNDFMFYFWGFAGEQIRFETPGVMFENASRELYILFESSKKCKRKLPISEIVIEEMGVDWQKVSTALLYAWFGSIQNARLSEFEKLFIWNDEFLSKEQFHDVLEKYAATYKQIKESPLKRQIFYSLPYVKTSHNEIISINTFLNLAAYEHCIFWIVRNYYQKKNDQIFTSVFGEYFEEYFRELLSTYLRESEFERIEETDAKRADWKLEIEGYRFLVEQKATLLALSGKQQTSDIEASKLFAKQAIIKAIRQLHITEKDFDDGQYIKVILVYEDYLKTEILDNIFAMEDCDVENDCFYWIVTINEMERLLSLCDGNRDAFKKVISEKIEREVKCSNDGRGLIQLLLKDGHNSNRYLQQNKIKKYCNMVRS